MLKGSKQKIWAQKVRRGAVMIEIPKDWRVAALSEIGTIITGTTPPTKVREYWGKGFPFVTPTDFSEKKYVDQTERMVTNRGAEIARLIPKDSIMVVCIASVGEVAMASTECITNQQINTIVCNQGTDCHFVYYAMVFSKTRLKRWAGITTSPIIKKSLFEKFPLPLPPLPEQKKIAEVLSTVDQAIGKVDEAIEKTQRLKKGLMQELLTKGIGHKEFKDTEIGRIPKEWEVVKLGEIIKYEKGRKPKILFDQEEKNTIPYLSAETLRTGTFIQWATENRELIKVNNDDVILIWDGYYCGDSFIGFDGLLSSTMIKIEPKNPNLNKRFLFYFLKACFKELNTKISGMYLKHVNKFILESQTLPLPPLHEQQKIAEILSTVDERLELLRNRKERLKRTKKGLMDDLLTGRKRVRLEV